MFPHATATTLFLKETLKQARTENVTMLHKYLSLAAQLQQKQNGISKLHLDSHNVANISLMCAASSS